MGIFRDTCIQVNIRSKSTEAAPQNAPMNAYTPIGTPPIKANIEVMINVDLGYNSIVIFTDTTIEDEASWCVFF